MKNYWRPLKRKILPYVMFAFSRALSWTLRWEVQGFEPYAKLEGGAIFCAWHGRSLIPAQFLRRKGLWALFSHSRDGQMQSKLFQLLGYRSIRGSTGRGGERAAIEAIRLLRKGERMAITPDGPRGPNREIQGGVLLMAKKSGAALVPMGASAKRAWVLKTWDGYLIPKPFSKVTLRFGPAIHLSDQASEDEVESARCALAQAMTRLEDGPIGDMLPAPDRSLKARWRRTRPKVLAPFLYGLARAIGGTIRWRVSGLENVEQTSSGILLCVWHGRTYAPATFMRGRGIWALFSLSNDGELQSRLYSLLGYRVIRGSTGRGGERAAIEAIRVLRAGDTLAITPDGPRGPAGIVQGGALLMARKSGAAMVPIGTAASRAWTFGTWDAYHLPKFFSKVSVRFGEPIWLSSDATEAETEATKLKLAEAMNRLQAEAEREVGPRDPRPEAQEATSASK